MTILTPEVKLCLEELARDRFSVVALWVGELCFFQDGLDEIWRHDKRLYHLTAAFLDHQLPHLGPPPEEGEKPLTKYLHNGVSEFQLAGWPDDAVRILWFFGDEERTNPQEVVCVDAFWKAGRSGPQDRVPRAFELREQFLDRKNRGLLEYTTERRDK